jgi:hypothetical protein
MAFQLIDFQRNYVKHGDLKGYFNVARSDEAAASPRYYAFLNESGAYVIQQIVITAGVGVYTYYANNGKGSLTTDWANRSGGTLTYVEYNLLF